MKRFLLIALVLLMCVPGRAQLIKTKSSSIVTIEGRSYYVHTVRKGETVYSLARLYGVSEQELLESNPQAVEGLQPDQVLKIRVTDVKPKMKPRKMARLFDTHTVNQGETAYAISKRYGISVNVLMEDNPGMDPAALSIGQRSRARLRIPKSRPGGKSTGMRSTAYRTIMSITWWPRGKRFTRSAGSSASLRPRSFAATI